MAVAKMVGKESSEGGGIERVAKQLNMTREELDKFAKGREEERFGAAAKRLEIGETEKESAREYFENSVRRFFKDVTALDPEPLVRNYRNELRLVIKGWGEMSHEEREAARDRAYAEGRLPSSRMPPDVLQYEIAEMDRKWDGLDAFEKREWLLEDEREGLDFDIETYPGYSEFVRKAERDALKGASSLYEIGRILEYGRGVLGGYDPSETPILILVGRRLEEFSGQKANDIPDLDIGKRWADYPARFPKVDPMSNWKSPFVPYVIGSEVPGEALRQLFATMHYVYWDIEGRQRSLGRI